MESGEERGMEMATETRTGLVEETRVPSNGKGIWKMEPNNDGEVNR